MESTPYCFFINGLMKRADGGVIKVSRTRESRVRFAHDERGARHGLNAAGNGEFVLPCSDGPRCAADGFHARRAKAIDGCAGDALWQAREQERHSRDVAVVFAGLIGAAEYDFIELLPVSIGIPLCQRAQRNRGEVIGMNG